MAPFPEGSRNGGKFPPYMEELAPVNQRPTLNAAPGKGPPPLKFLSQKGGKDEKVRPPKIALTPKIMQEPRGKSKKSNTLLFHTLTGSHG